MKRELEFVGLCVVAELIVKGPFAAGYVQCSLGFWLMLFAQKIRLKPTKGRETIGEASEAKGPHVSMS